ncbi:MAG TPA: prepilin peptidase [Candidatus Eisenbacteria bacterium]|jgi:prepilin signal peptidase PulO-like enzyme (type II secretory pathway)|nr:prepilin peptidase [Candidatus Eisenbacteria bacterium]
MTPLVAIFVFGFGTVIGSFLNAVLWRIRTGEGFVYGRSYCPCCRHTLAAKDLIPVFSYLLLRGRCRYCSKGIHPSYLAVELAMGALFVAFAMPVVSAGLIDGKSLASMLLHWYFAAVLMLIFVYDLRYMLIPRSVTVWAMAVAAAGGLLLGARPLTLAVGFAVGGGVFWLQYAISKGKWIGGGDIQLGALMGLMLGWPLILVALFIAYVSGALFGGVLLASKKTSWQSQIPFGTFLTAATVVTLLWGQPILTWYLGLTI